MNETSKKINPNGQAIYQALAEHKGELFTFAEIAHMAGVEAKTGYLTSAKKIAADNKAEIVKVDAEKGGVETVQKIVTCYPSGLEVATERKVVVAGYKLVDKD